MEAAPILGLIGSVIGAIGQLSAARGQEGAGEEAERLARERAENERREAREEARRLQMQNEEAQSARRARAAASGVEAGSGSPALFAEFARQEEERELDWLLSSAESRAGYTEAEGSAARQEGSAAASATRARAFGDLFGAAGSFGSQYKWWQGGPS